MSEHRFMLSFSFIFICCWPIYVVLKVLNGLCSSICLQFIRVSSCLLSFATLLSRRWLELNTPFLGPSLCCWWFTSVYWPFPHSFVRYFLFYCLLSPSTCFLLKIYQTLCWRKHQSSSALYYFGAFYVLLNTIWFFSVLSCFDSKFVLLVHVSSFYFSCHSPIANRKFLSSERQHWSAIFIFG